MYDINCSLIILHTKDEIVLQKRTFDAPTLAGKWGFFGGGIDDDETSYETVIREAKEELDYTLIKPRLLLEKEFKLEGKSGYMFVYIEKIQCSKDTIVCLEGEKLGWFKKDEISQLKMLPHDNDVIFKLFEKIEKIYGLQRL